MQPDVHDFRERLRAVPVAYWVLAGVLGAALYILGSVTPQAYGVFGNGMNAEEFFRQLAGIGVLLAAASPVIALVAPRTALATAVTLPVILFLLANQHQWPFTMFLAVLAVAVCTMRDRQVLAWLFGLFAMVFPISLVFWGSMVTPDGALIDLRSYGDPFDSLVTVTLYAIGVLLALGAGALFRSRVAAGVAGRRALARAGQVEEQATVVGERARLARDLHDVVAHHVSLIAVRAETAPYTNTDLDEPARAVLAEIAADARLALDELRGVLGILGRSGGDAERMPQPGWSDIGALVERSRGAGSVVMVRGDGADSGDVAPSVGYAAYRVVQEALTNARKHAPGRPVTVSLTRTDPMVVVRVGTPLRGDAVDDGIGHGLLGMRERVESLDGRLMAGAVDDEFVVEATLPQGTA
ncbi:sensor histidine kinase [Nocardioides marmoriginsengisoli]|nr:histidine kinase [Nocardioides marmoriginsengisoli]